MLPMRFELTPMQAWVLEKPGPIRRSPLRLKEIPTPQPGPNQIRLRVKACGICHTDLHIAEGEIDLPKLPLIPGHQIVGIVESLGPGGHRYRVGERLGVPWLYSNCGHCENCIKRRENLCLRASFTGYHVHGGYAEFVVVSERAAYPLPRAYSDLEAAPLLCAGAIGFRALRLCGIRGSRLGLYGFGASAHLTLQAARRLGCAVYVFSRSPAHRALARRLGAVWAGTAGQNPPKALDGAILFAPVGALVPAALKQLRPGGTLVLAGIAMSPIPRMDYGLIYGERRLVSVANGTAEDIREFLRLAGRHRFEVEIERFSFLDAPAALRKVKSGAVQGAAVLEVNP